MAEWLRRLTRNQLGSSRAGSNPVNCGHFLHYFYFVYLYLFYLPYILVLYWNCRKFFIFYSTTYIIIHFYKLYCYILLYIRICKHKFLNFIRLTRNQLGSPRVGSNPINCAHFLHFFYFVYIYLFYLPYILVLYWNCRNFLMFYSTNLLYFIAQIHFYKSYCYIYVFANINFYILLDCSFI